MAVGDRFEVERIGLRPVAELVGDYLGRAQVDDAAEPRSRDDDEPEVVGVSIVNHEPEPLVEAPRRHNFKPIEYPFSLQPHREDNRLLATRTGRVSIIIEREFISFECERSAIDVEDKPANADGFAADGEFDR